MASNVRAVLTSVAVCGVLLLAGCGGSSSTTADSGWNPPRPTGVPDEKWATVVDADPASLPGEDLSGAYCQAVKPEPAEVDAKASTNTSSHTSPHCVLTSSQRPAPRARRE